MLDKVMMFYAMHMYMFEAIANGANKGAFATANIKQMTMSLERPRGQDIRRDQGLGGRHQSGVVTDLGRMQTAGILRLRVGPIIGEARGGALPAEQCDGIDEVCVERRIMLDHIGDARIAP